MYSNSVSTCTKYKEGENEGREKSIKSSNTHWNLMCFPKSQWHWIMDRESQVMTFKCVLVGELLKIFVLACDFRLTFWISCFTLIQWRWTFAFVPQLWLCIGFFFWLNALADGSRGFWILALVPYDSALCLFTTHRFRFWQLPKCSTTTPASLHLSFRHFVATFWLNNLAKRNGSNRVRQDEAGAPSTGSSTKNSSPLGRLSPTSPLRCNNSSYL